MKTIKIKGKDYIEVNERIKYFRENFKGWALITEIVKIENGVCIMTAHVKDEKGITIATGTAYEKEGSTFINKTSYIENCETSAWGRALGNLGIGINASIASAEEVKNAINNQLPELNKKSKYWTYTYDKYISGDIDMKTIEEKYTVSDTIKILLNDALDEAIENESIKQEYTTK
jgi:hypothetical protein